MNLKYGSTKGENNLDDIINKLQGNIKMPQMIPPADIKDCEHCIKKNVCKYKERIEEAMVHLDNLLNGDDEQFADLPLVVNVKCKEFNWVTGVR